MKDGFKCYTAFTLYINFRIIYVMECTVLRYAIQLIKNNLFFSFFFKGTFAWNDIMTINYTFLMHIE